MSQHYVSRADNQPNSPNPTNNADQRWFSVMGEIAELRKKMKKAKEEWKANKDDTKLRKKFKKLKKALKAAKEAKVKGKVSEGGAGSVAAEGKKTEKKSNKKRKTSDSATPVLAASQKPQKKKQKTKKISKNGTPNGSSSATKSSASDAEIKAFRQEHKIKLEGADLDHKPFLSFSDLNFPSKYKSAIKSFKNPTPIQAEAWPIALRGRDIIGIAATGSGKTLGFTLPCLPKIAHIKLGRSMRERGPLMLVLSPTRELAMQTQEVAVQVCAGCGLRSVCVIGGGNKWKMATEFKQGYHILVATPGRLQGFIREGEISLGKVIYAVLDEADRMLDEGFGPSVREIMSQVSVNRQTLLFSATWPQEVKKLGLELVRKPVIIFIGDRGEKLVANKRVTQTIEVIDEGMRDDRLHALLKKYHNGKNRVIVFCLYKKEAARVESMLRRRKWKCQSIHGNKSQPERTAALGRFKEGSEPLLVATDVAARGLDVDDVEVVLNYAFPLTVEDYVHRIGRTGRAGKSGISHTFFTKNNKALSGELIQVLNQAGAPVPKDLLAFGTGVKRKKHPMYGDHYRHDDRPMPKATRIVFD